MKITFKVATSSCLSKLKSITVLLYDFSTVNEKILLSRLDLYCGCHVHPKDEQLF